MPTARISAESIAAFEEALGTISRTTPATADDNLTHVSHEQSAFTEWYSDFERIMCLEDCLNGAWDRAWKRVADEVQRRGMTRAVWEEQMRDAMRSDATLHTNPM